jgi:hypothetical protein
VFTQLVVTCHTGRMLGCFISDQISGGQEKRA